MYCMFCGNKIPENSVFCRYCGKKLVDDRNAATAPETPPAAKVGEATEPKASFSNSPILPDAPDSSAFRPSENVANEVKAASTVAPASVASPVSGTESASSCEPPPIAPPPSQPSIQPTYDDNVIVRNFSKAQPSSAARLNADFGLELNEGKFLQLRRLCHDTLRRDPTVGELRVLATMAHAANRDLTREAVGELYTDSSLIAETWADMMAKHAALLAVRGTARATVDAPVPPCTLGDALTLAERYLRRTGVCLPITDGGKNSQGRTAVLSAPWQEAEALAAGYIPLFRAHVGSDSRSVWIRRGGALPVTPEKAGDFLLCLRHTLPQTIEAFIEHEKQKTHPAVGDVRAVVGRSMLEAVLSLCSGAELSPHHLLRTESNTPIGRIEADMLCALPAPSSDGAADYILRVPAKRMQEIREELQALSADVVVIGQVRKDDKILVRMRNRMGNQDVVAATLPAALLRNHLSGGLHLRRAEADSEPAPASLGISSPAVTRLYSPHATESSLTPDGCETVALTCTEGQIIPVPEAQLLLSSFAVTVTREGVGFFAAGEVLSTAAESLIQQGVAPENIRLAVSITSKDGMYAPGNMTVEVLCGLYRYSASCGIPAEDPAMTVIPPAEGDTPSVSITVTAWARDRELCERLAAEVNPPRDNDTAKESRSFVLPVLHRSYESSLRALATALSAQGETAVSLLPLAMSTVEVEIPVEEFSVEETSAENIPTVAEESLAEEDAVKELISPLPTRKETRRVLNPISVSRLAERLEQPQIPVFAMNAEDARMLLAESAVISALEHRLDNGYPVIVLNGACTAFGEVGLLPTALDKITFVPAVGEEVIVTCSATGKTAVRIPCTDLLTPTAAADIPHLVTMTLPSGNTLSDGFTGRNGHVLGLLNGTDATTLSLFFANTFENN